MTPRTLIEFGASCLLVALVIILVYNSLPNDDQKVIRVVNNESTISWNETHQIINVKSTSDGYSFLMSDGEKFTPNSTKRGVSKFVLSKDDTLSVVLSFTNYTSRGEIRTCYYFTNGDTTCGAYNQNVLRYGAYLQGYDEVTCAGKQYCYLHGGTPATTMTSAVFHLPKDYMIREGL